jgi:enoyl-CoA hydratase/carnithine racemase
MRLVDTADVLIENMRPPAPAGRRDTGRVEAMIEACFQSGDYREGQRAFAEKRPPAFTGR